ncbi:c-type cytochrome [Sphingomonas changnyeongensis]|uniref:C-type cytochrome n=1 Tax=Sphingomonas changnyeongensis TaxID=2698679 RepID=A0A7Z2S5J3_9SPHN|nr:cytochrome c family protein [Sphingomonas changnyeongensis]QHL90433.1 c-type cytochrome [Sphingomonas changnyeongensis]
MRGMAFGLGIMMLGMAGAAQAQTNPNFVQCAVCHSVKAGQNKIGPHLAGIVGRKRASVAGYSYSAAMKGKPGVWTEKELDLYLTNPRKHVPGTKMAFAGIPDAAKRAKLIAYLKTVK